MAREKATITVDRTKVETVRAFTGARSTSQAIDLALSELIRAEQLRRDVEAYAKVPPTEDDIALALTRPDWDDLADDTDWSALYANDES
jgi:hypothetical protein